MRRIHFLVLAACTIAVARVEAAETSIKIRGQGWAETGRIMHTTDTLEVNLNGNWLQSTGAQFTAVAAIGSNFEGAFGLGGYQVYHSLGSPSQARSVRYTFENFITEARMTYFQGEREAPWFSATFGNFDYNYNPDIKNLGLYMLRGPVYPGFLSSGFRSFRVDTTKGDILGLRLNHAMGSFRHDLIMANERETPPTFDWSLAYVARYRMFGALELGAGFNFYRLLSANKDLTDPGRAPEQNRQERSNPIHAYDSRYIEVTPGGDTIRYTHRGTKLMGMFNLDLKPLFGGMPSQGPNDFKIYGEAAVLGVKNYGRVYNDIKQRIPVVVGFNFPTFGLLDYLSLEVEWYGARYRNDLRKLGSFNSLPGIAPAGNTAPIPSPVPVSYQDYATTIPAWTNGVDSATGRLLVLTVDAEGNPVLNPTGPQVTGTGLDVQNLVEDNWKWSLNIEKTLHRHVSFSAQVANDHFRPRPAASTINEVGGMTEAFTSPKDWYFMVRLGYFF